MLAAAKVGIDKKNEIYYWYRVKKIAQIIAKENDKNKSFEYIKDNL